MHRAAALLQVLSRCLSPSPCSNVLSCSLNHLNEFMSKDEGMSEDGLINWKFCLSAQLLSCFGNIKEYFSRNTIHFAFTWQFELTTPRIQLKFDQTKCLCTGTVTGLITALQQNASFLCNLDFFLPNFDLYWQRKKKTFSTFGIKINVLVFL